MLFNPYYRALEEPCSSCHGRMTPCRLPVLISVCRCVEQIQMGRATVYAHIKAARLSTQLISGRQFLETKSLLALRKFLSSGGRCTGSELPPAAPRDDALSEFCLPREIRLSESQVRLGLSSFLVKKLSAAGDITIMSMGRARLIQTETFVAFLDRNRDIGSGRRVLNKHQRAAMHATRG